MCGQEFMLQLPFYQEGHSIDAKLSFWKGFNHIFTMEREPKDES